MKLLERVAQISIINRCIILICTYHIFILGMICIGRAIYPFHLDWIEGAHVDVVARILDGQAIYTPPTLDYIPFIYTPFFFWVSALVSKIMGLGFLPLRLVSILSSFLSLYLIHRIIRRQSGSLLAALLGAGLMAATYKISGSSMDMGRIDALAMLLLLGGINALHAQKNAAVVFGAGILFGLAYMTKQLAALPILGLTAHLILTRSKHFIFWALGGLITVGGLSLFLQWQTDGWYGYYTFELPRMVTKYFVTEWVVRFWTNDLWKFLAIPTLASFFYIAFGKRRLFFFLTFTSMLIGSFLVRSNDGGSPNALLPIYSIIAILFGLSFAKLQTTRLKPIVSILAITALFMPIFSPLKQIPNTSDRIMGQKILSVMRATPGSLYAPRYGYLPRMANKTPNAHRSVLADLIRTDKTKSKIIRAEIKHVFKNQEYAAILCQSDLFPEVIQKYYIDVENIPLVKSRFWWPNAEPITYYLPRQQD
ncbi:MAG: 4-amino-4-deoxy-L-arabinose transferase-like glycosyltransferase [Candidatus Omnitrophota bacterium]|jgi:4-amino-4-deoxy-L-arabinose transferase-like glycosyltransferase